MKLYVNANNEIKDVNSSSDPSLTLIEIEDEEFPFAGWSEAKICCYKIYTEVVPIYPDPEPNDGEEGGDEPTPEPEPIGTKTIVTGYTPYVDSRLLEHIDQLGKQTEAITPYTDTKTAYIGDTEITFYDTPATGNLTVYCPGNYHVDRLVDRIFITFDEIEEVTEITISIL